MGACAGLLQPSALHWGCDMAKKNARPPKNEKTSVRSKRKFTGTDNPRHLRVIMALLTSPRPREAIDRIAGASNGPELMAELRRRGLEAPCSKTPCIDRDGFEVKRGIYHFTDQDKRLIRAWLKRRDRQRKQGGRA
jgi:hypothetical protein